MLNRLDRSFLCSAWRRKVNPRTGTKDSDDLSFGFALASFPASDKRFFPSVRFPSMVSGRIQISTDFKRFGGSNTRMKYEG